VIRLRLDLKYVVLLASNWPKDRGQAWKIQFSQPEKNPIFQT
jgi:hypothetical protein